MEWVVGLIQVLIQLFSLNSSLPIFNIFMNTI
jgi:hypothetical protein